MPEPKDYTMASCARPLQAANIRDHTKPMNVVFPKRALPEQRKVDEKAKRHPVSVAQREKTIFLFDIDGTLTKPRQKIDSRMADFLSELRRTFHVGLVGGSDLAKIVEQMGSSTDDVLSNFDYVFAENGLVAYKRHQLLSDQTILNRLSEEQLKRLANFCLHYIADLDIPIKRGNFFEFRGATINISPIGGNCSQAEREAFTLFDAENKIRDRFVDRLRETFSDDGLQFAIGGQIGIVCFPRGWDKTYCLDFLVDDGFEVVHFFGDKTEPGGIDFEIFHDPRTVGHSVRDPEDTRRQAMQLVETMKNVNV